jgi:Rad3-related DNA helicase
MERKRPSTVLLLDDDELFTPASIEPPTLKDVMFPYPHRTPLQDDITRKLLEAIHNGKDCLIESATGTGKTLCLLSACLTAQQSPSEEVRRVFYLTRTHSQMECIVKQFEELGYGRVGFALKQSKKGLCGNEEILELAKHCNYEDFEKICDMAKLHSQEEEEEVQ